MYLKYFFIQNIKALFSFLKLHVIFEPFSGFFLNLAYYPSNLNGLIKIKKFLTTIFLPQIAIGISVLAFIHF